MLINSQSVGISGYGIINKSAVDCRNYEELYNPALYNRIKKLVETGHTKTAIAKELGCSIPWISRVFNHYYPEKKFPLLHEKVKTNKNRRMQLDPEKSLFRLIMYHAYVVNRKRFLKAKPKGMVAKGTWIRDYTNYIGLTAFANMTDISASRLLKYVKVHYPDGDYYEGIEYHLENETIDINTRMKFKDILEWVNYNRITGPYDIKDELEDDVRHITLVRRDENETICGELSLEGNTITGLEIDTNDYRDIAQDMINYLCSVADKENFNIMVDGKTADGRIKSFLTLAGFRNDDDNILMRTPGAARVI
jgi:hypothetical protein